MPKSVVAVLSLAVGLLSSQVLAETYTYNGGDVTQATSFSPEGTPGAGDTILIPAETDLVITSSTPGWNAIAALGSSGHIVPLAATSRLVLNVAEAESVDFTVPSTAWHYKSYFYEVYPLGVLVKRGLGEVTLAFGGGDAYKFGDGNCCYTLNRIVVEEGTLTTDTTGSCTYLRLYGFEVAQGATACFDKSVYFYDGFSGEGTISAKAGSSVWLNTASNASHPGVFNGKLTGTLNWQVQDGGRQSVLSTMSDNTIQTNLGKGYYGVGSLGDEGEPSSVGTHLYLWFTAAGSYLEYLGSGGESVGKAVVLGQGQGEPVTISAGPTGGIEFKRIIYPGGKTDYPPHVRLAGSNTAEAAISGTIQENALGNSVYFSKIGSGTWRFKDSAGRLNANGFAVREGRLIFDSIAETNAFCSLGVATNLFDGSTGPGWTADAHRTDIFLTLGSTNGQAAVFEWGGANSQACTTRPIGLDGIGGHFRNDNPETQIRWRGARAIGGTPTLTLDGASTKTNELADIADGLDAQRAKVALGVCKDGTGTWKISGDTTFSGPLEVKAGKLIVAAPTTNLYSWFRWTLRGHKPGVSGSTFQIEEFGLYSDNNTKRVNDGLELMSLSANGWGEMGLNTMALQWPGGVVYGNQDGKGPWGDGVESELGLVDHQKNYGFRISPRNFGAEVSPVANAPTTHLPVVFRLDPKTAGEITGWDYMNLWGCASEVSAWSTLLEGSVDGLHWEYLDENTELDEAALGSASWMWSFKKQQMAWADYAYSHTGNTGARPISGHSSRTYSVLSGNPVVSVAAGAVLEAEGPVEVSKLSINMKDSGAMRGFRLAPTGTIDVTGIDGLGGMTDFYFDPETAANMSGWTVTSAGVPDANITCRINPVNGRLTVSKKGLVLIFR